MTPHERAEETICRWYKDGSHTSLVQMVVHAVEEATADLRDLLAQQAARADEWENTARVWCDTSKRNGAERDAIRLAAQQQSEEVQRDWLSPMEAQSLLASEARLREALRSIVAIEPDFESGADDIEQAQHIASAALSTPPGEGQQTPAPSSSL
jgi:hypothetical protein